MARILFVDDQRGGVSEVVNHLLSPNKYFPAHYLIAIDGFISVGWTSFAVKVLQPDAIVIGYGLGKPETNGAQVIRALRDRGYVGVVVANSGGGEIQFTRDGVAVDASVDRNPTKLKQVLDQLKPEAVLRDGYGNDMKPSLIYEVLEALVKGKQTEEGLQALEILGDLEYGWAEQAVIPVLRRGADRSLIDAALKKFAKSYVDDYDVHGGWVHCLSHFTYELWNLNLIDWIKRLYQMAFVGAYERTNPRCLERLVLDFIRKSKWDADPAEFSITRQYLDYPPGTEGFYPKECIFPRVEQGKFASEDAYLVWSLRQQKQVRFWSNKETWAKIKRLRDIGGDTSEFTNL